MYLIFPPSLGDSHFTGCTVNGSVIPPDKRLGRNDCNYALVWRFGWFTSCIVDGWILPPDKWVGTGEDHLLSMMYCCHWSTCILCINDITSSDVDMIQILKPQQGNYSTSTSTHAPSCSKQNANVAIKHLSISFIKHNQEKSTCSSVVTIWRHFPSRRPSVVTHIHTGRMLDRRRNICEAVFL